jgi:uncharacterized protein
MAKTKFKNDIPPELIRQHITVGSQGTFIVVSVKPNSTKERIFISETNELTLAVRAPAVHDKANERVIEIVAEIFGISKSHIEIISGHRARTKRILIATTYHDFLGA